jgi:stage II sporulation protein R
MKKFINYSRICLILIFCAQSYSNAVSSELSNSVFRLHVLANSDSEEDQQLKLKVRDALLSYMNTLSSNCNTKEEAIQIATQHQNEFQTIAENVIVENGYNYPVQIKINNFYFPTKSYGDISLPAGYYDALRVEIGNAKGKNWWCVMFPSLCFIDISSGIVDSEGKEKLENNLDSESYELISESKTSTEFKLKFKLLEVFSHNGLFTAKN